jgi:CheY-like chemotaxis protein
MAARILLMGAGASLLEETLGASAQGLTLETATSGDVALERARVGVPDLVVLAGTDEATAALVDALSDDPKTDSIPILVVGVGATISGIARMVALGARVVAPSELALRRAIDETLAIRVRLGGSTALVADDDPAVTWFFGDLLRQQGCEVVEAFDGDTALARAFAEPPDLVVSDVLMPGLQGELLVRRMRADAVLRDVPVVLLSWKDDWLSQARENGVDAAGYLTKSSDPETVLTCLRSVLARRTDLKTRLRAEPTVRGVLEDVTPHRLLRMTSELRADARVSVRDGASLHEVHLRGGVPLTATCVSSNGTVVRGPTALASLLRLRAGRFVVATDRGQVNADLRGSLAAQLAEQVPALRAGVVPSVPETVYVTMPPAPVYSAVDEATEPMQAPPPLEPWVVTVRLPPVQVAPPPRPAAVAPQPPAPPPHAPQQAPQAAPYTSFAPVDRTLPLPRASELPRTPATRIATPKKRSVSRETWLRLGAVAAVVAVAASGLAVGVGLRVFHDADSSAASSRR